MIPSARPIDALVADYMAGRVDEASMTAWLRSVCAEGLSQEDTYELAMAMARSGEVVDWSGIDGPIVDKHSTGGVGDAISLIAVPLAAACGVKVAKLSGRALGHTGGTLDKLECIPGLRTELGIDAFRTQVARVGCAIAAASDALAPADKRLYALRHRTGTVASIPLIAASIMSKKIAGGAPAIVLDVKAGAAAFMPSVDDARALARTMREIGRRAGRSVTTVITRMDDPLADSAGDALELDEAIALLERRGGSRELRAAALAIATAMVRAAGFGPERVERALEDGAALAAFRSMTAAQGGRLDAFDRNFGPGVTVSADRSGFVQSIDARRIGDAVSRAKAGLPVEAARRVGVRVTKRRGDRVNAGDPVLTSWLPAGIDELRGTVLVADDAPVQTALVVEEVAGAAT